MIKQQLYPKTSRVEISQFTITEKLDGSNLSVFKIDDMLYFATRKIIFTENELNEIEVKGLKRFISDNIEQLRGIRNNSCIIGEFIGNGRLKYNFDKRFFMFAKANVEKNNDIFLMKNINYGREFFTYSFIEEKIPDCIDLVPFVGQYNEIDLDVIYDEYTKKVNRNVEGLIIINGRYNIQKYVRMKDGKLTEHFVS